MVDVASLIALAIWIVKTKFVCMVNAEKYQNHVMKVGSVGQDLSAILASVLLRAWSAEWTVIAGCTLIPFVVIDFASPKFIVVVHWEWRMAQMANAEILFARIIKTAVLNFIV
jgi:hypothetical protein